MNNQLRDKERLKHMLDAIDFVLKHTDGKSFDAFQDNEVLSFAVVKNLEIIGEAASKITKETKDTRPDIEWKKIVGARHIFVHAYYDTDWNIVWTAATQQLPVLKVALTELLATVEKDENATN